MDSQGPLDDEIRIEAEGQWLWVLIDRIRLDTRLQADLHYRHDPLGTDEFQPLTRYALSSNLLVFVENSLSLTAGANVEYVHDGLSAASTSALLTGFQFSVDYVLSRSLR